jgi:hypothetical protein
MLRRARLLSYAVLLLSYFRAVVELCCDAAQPPGLARNVEATGVPQHSLALQAT